MKKNLILIILALIAVFTLAMAGIAYAQQTEPTEPPATCPFTGEGCGGTSGDMMGGWRGMMGGYRDNAEGPMHDAMVAAAADALDIDPAEMEERLEAGETLYSIAEEKGLTLEEFRTLQDDIRKNAIAAAVAEGAITQEQADWMLERMEYREKNGGGSGCGMHGGRGVTGGGRGWRSMMRGFWADS